MHQASSSMIAIVVSVLAHVSLMILSASAKAGNYTAANVSPFHGSSKAFVQEGPETWLVLRSQTYFVQSGDKVTCGGRREPGGEVTYLHVYRPVLYWLLVCY